MIQMIWLVLGGEEKKCMLCCALLMQLGLKQSGKNCTAQLIYPVRNGMVWYAAVSTHTLGLFIWRGRGEGAGSESFLVHCFACWTWTTPEAILFSLSLHLLLDPGYRLWSLASRTECSVSAGTWYWQIYFLPVLLLGKQLPSSKNWHMPV